MGILRIFCRVGVDAVLASDIKTSCRECLESGPFVHADVQDYQSLARIVLEHGIDHIIHLASLLSGETNRCQVISAESSEKGAERSRIWHLHSASVYGHLVNLG